MQLDNTHMTFTKQVHFLLITREEDFKELSKKIAEVHHQQNSNLETLTECIVLLERHMSSMESE